MIEIDWSGRLSSIIIRYADYARSALFAEAVKSNQVATSGSFQGGDLKKITGVGLRYRD